MDTKLKSRGLGRGLNALFEDEETPSFAASNVTPEPSAEAMGAAAALRARQVISIAQIRPNATQPRRVFTEQAIEDLAASIREHGILQPIVVRRIGEPAGSDSQFEIVAGERRWRAAQRAQLHEVPISIVELTDSEVLEVALVENLQREDLNPIEEAMGYFRLMEDYKRTQEEVAKIIGKSRSHIANTVRLLNLPDKVKDYLQSGKLSMGHARALITANDAERLAEEIVSRGLNVRQTEQLAATADPKRRLARAPVQKDVDTMALEQDLTNMLGMRVYIDAKGDGKSGALRVEFKNLDQLDDLVLRLSKIPKVVLAD